MALRTQEKITGAQKAAIFMILVGDEAASSVYRHLSSEQVEELTREIARVDYVSQDLALQVLGEFHKLSLAHQHVAKGGTDYAQRLLVNAFGEASAKDLIQQTVRTGAICSQDLDLVQRADPKQPAKLVQGENPQTVALLLAHLGAKTASALLKLSLAMVLALLYLLILKPLKKQLSATLREMPARAAAATPALAAGGPTGATGLPPLQAGGLLEAGSGTSPVGALKETLSQKVTNEAVEISRLLQDWLGQP